MEKTRFYVGFDSGIPLTGCIAFGVIDRGTNLIQVRPISGCVLNCIFCSIDEGPYSRTRITQYVVEREYLVEWVKQIVEFKGAHGIEAHIDCAGESTLYEELPELVYDLAQIKGIEKISMQTHGTLLNYKLVDRLVAAGLTRINLSIDAMDEELAKKLSGSSDYNLEKVLGIAEYIANTRADILIAPVWVPRYNDSEIPKLIEFAKRIKAGKEAPPLGIQKYEAHKFGRKPKATKPMTWYNFYNKLKNFEQIYGVKLVLSPWDFGIHKRRKLPVTMKKGEIIKAKIAGPGWMVGEKLAVARNRAITVVKADNLPEDSIVKVRILRNKDNLYIAEPA